MSDTTTESAESTTKTTAHLYNDTNTRILAVSSLFVDVKFRVPLTLEVALESIKLDLAEEQPNLTDAEALVILLDSAFSNSIYRCDGGLPLVRSCQSDWFASKTGLTPTVVYQTDGEGVVKVATRGKNKGEPLVDAKKSESDELFCKRALAELIKAGHSEEAIIAELTAFVQSEVDKNPVVAPSGRSSPESSLKAKKPKKAYLDIAKKAEAGGKLAALSARLANEGYTNDGTLDSVALAVEAKHKAQLAELES